MSDFLIRPENGPSDREFIVGLNPRLAEAIIAPTHSSEQVRSFQEKFTASSWDQDQGKSETFIAATHDGARLGYVHVRQGTDDVLDEPCAYIALLAVGQAHEGQGVAKALIGRAEEWAAAMGFERVALDVFASNTRALSFYERNGYTPETIRVVRRIG